MKDSNIDYKGGIVLDIYYLSLILIVATIAFPIPINHLAIVISIPCWMALLSRRSSRIAMTKAFTTNRTAIYFLALSLLIVASAMVHFNSYIGDVDRMLKTIEKRISFLWFPLLLSGSVLLSKARIRRLLLIFVYTMIITSLLCLIVGLIATITSGTITHVSPIDGVIENNFMYHRLGSYIGLHAVFFAAYNLLALVILMANFFLKKGSMSVSKKWINIGYIVFLSAVIFLLSSITISFIFLILIFLMVGYYTFLIIKSKRTRIILISIILLNGAGFGYNMINKLDIKKSLFEYNFSDNPGTEEQNWNALNLRLAMWEITSDALSEYWLLGVGPANMESALDSYYEKYDFQFGLMNHFNPHNQFLHTFLMLGISGLIGLLVIVYSIFHVSYKKKDVILGSLLLIFLVFSMTASTLAVNKGIVFFTFFFTLLTYLDGNTTSYLDRRGSGVPQATNS